MQTTIITNENNYRLINDSANTIGVRLKFYKKHIFPDGEISIKINNADENFDKSEKIMILHRILPPFIDQHSSFYELLSVSNQLKILGYSKIEAITPYLFYSRDDMLNNPPFDLNLRLIHESGIKKIHTLDFHNTSILNNRILAIQNYSPLSVFQKHIKKNPNLVIIAPDQGARNRAEGYSKHLDTPVVICNKFRSNNTIKVNCSDNLMKISNKDCLIVDDIISTGETLSKCANLLKLYNPKSINVCATHLIMPDLKKMRYNLKEFEQVYVSNSVNHKKLPKNISQVKIDIRLFLSD